MTFTLFARASGASASLRSSRVAVQLAFRYARFNSTAASLAPSPTSSTPSTLDSDAEPTSGRPFSALKGVIADKTFKALVDDMKMKTMTPVQEEVLSLLPEIAEPYDSKSNITRDLLVRAKTGTGKTIAFLVPAIEARIKAIEKAGKQAVIDAGLRDDPQLEARARAKFQRENVGALILSPTRELATQIANEAIKLLKHHDDMHVRLFTGGVNKRLQMRDWMRGSRDIVVATTGRLRDLLNSEADILKSVRGTQTFILDEADTMLEMGFRDDIHAIQQELVPSPQRQTLLFSATVAPVIRQVAKSVLAPANHHIDCVKSDDSPVHAHVPQYHTVLPNAAAQIPHLLRLIAHDHLTNPKQSKIILFFPTTRMTQLFSTVLRELAYVLPRRPEIYEIHSKRNMEARVKASKAFRTDRSSASILITSDVSARGVDYPGVTRVIQVGIPSSAEQYVHRVGRTGRQGGTVGRGDLVVLPWEVGFLTWQLTEVPIKPVTSGELKAQVEDLSKKVDQDEIHVDTRTTRTPLSPRLPEYESAPLELMPRFDEQAIRETFTSLLGYYLGKSGELRVTRNVILEGIKAWTMDACGLKVPPFVSDEFLAKLGLGDGKYSTKRYGMKPSGGWNARKDRPIWEGRGNVKRKMKERDEWVREEKDNRFGRGGRGRGGYSGGQSWSTSSRDGGRDAVGLR
ncbi:hypothetical protein GYMLUDRAFT_86278 [Collybiopsis luxurians FD-317 M1]|uniref:ATP-dependent RNA helicase n=1 Tax=Collybiopsis luxurians FD-317 M1 TaxID=944289 RepID=A0A0D0CJ88_9AGAR|nr:hypothetical protein GYMLUDRAFT_86278 [Collybiopsis luxurians FD-317 M1]